MNEKKMNEKTKILKIIVTDCGSTTTKAILFEYIDNQWRMVARGEAPTTVEKPVADVTVGIRNSFLELQDILEEKIIDETLLETEKCPLIFRENQNQKDGVDAYLSTSSAGGGLQMIVSGIVKKISAESSQKAALGAGAIILDVLSEDDLLTDYEKIQKIKRLKPDIFLLAGGINGGDKKNVIEQAQVLLSASPSPRFGNTLKLPVVFAGNQDAKDEIENILAEKFDLKTIKNIRPTIDNEDLQEAKDAIHDIFLSHVMSHSPGYDKLVNWTHEDICPTPVAVGEMIESYAKEKDISVLCVDIGGATTDVFTYVKNEEGKYNFIRTVSANLGMSYSIGNVLKEAGIENIKKWLDFEIKDSDLINKLKNKMLRPTTLPQTMQDLKIEQATAREALKLSFNHHKSFALGTIKFKKSSGIANIFSQKNLRSFMNIKDFDLIIGSGGVLSHSPKRLDSALILIDAFKPFGVVELAVDSVFMLPHLGVFSRINKQGANAILENDCLIRICHAVIPKYNKKKLKSDVVLSIFVDGEKKGDVIKDKILTLELEENKEYEISLKPKNRYVDIGCGNGKEKIKKIKAGKIGLLLDGRNSWI